MALHVHKVSMGTLSYWYEIPYYYILGIIGTWMVIQSCRLLEGKENTFVNALIYVGEHTFIILALHFSCFKLINLFKIKYYGLVEQPYGSYPIIANDPSENSIVWFGLYIISGVVLPLIIERIFRMIKYNYE